MKSDDEYYAVFGHKPESKERDGPGSGSAARKSFGKKGLSTAGESIMRY